MASGPRPAGKFGFNAALEARRSAGLLRRRVAVEERDGAVIRLDGRELINFCSNDYLGLAGHPRIVEAWSQAAGRFGVGAGASPMVSGRFRVHEELERALARRTGRDRALLFPDGYQANLAVIATLGGRRGDRVLMDRLCHASLIDGARLGRARWQRFSHNDIDSLQALLGQGGHGFKLVVTESVYSMDGDLAPLPEYARACERHGACLYVDDAHGFGVLGGSGGGGPEHHALTQYEVPLVMATFGKALGVAGGFVAGPAELIETLVQYARPYIYSTAMPPAQAAAVLESLNVMDGEGWRREHLRGLVQRFRARAGEFNLPLTGSTSPIQPLIMGEADAAVAVSENLRQRGYYAVAIRPPAVPENSSRIRITLSAVHTAEQVEGLVSALAEALD